MKIFSADQIRRWDEATVSEQHITSFELMERAAFTCVNWLIENDLLNKNIHIFCGTGNNGGDGLAMARILYNAGVRPRVYALDGDPSALNVENRKLLEQLLPITIVNAHSSLPALKPTDLIIETVFGTGLSRKPEGISAELIKHLNNSGSTIISIDVPGGLFTDRIINEGAVTATHTLTFQALKFSFFFPESEKFLGKVHVMNIGLSREFSSAEPARFELLEKADIAKLIMARKPFSHKGNYGHAAIIAGSKGMMGAAVLAARGCLNAGAGKLTCYVPEEGLNIIQTSVPAAMARTTGRKNKDIIHLEEGHSVIGIGPGLGRNKKEKKFLEALFAVKCPLVIDADALNALASNKDLVKIVPKDSILTPHPGEFDRLFGPVSNRALAAIEAAKKHKVFIVLKGRYTCIASPDGNGYFNPTGNAGMARGGMGDVLTGIITGLRSQGYSAKSSCMLGVYLHGLAGDLAAADLSEHSLQPEDVVNYLGKGFLSLVPGS